MNVRATSNLKGLISRTCTVHVLNKPIIHHQILAVNMVSFPAQFFTQDGAYSWVVLVTIILSSFSSIGFLLGTLGPLSDVLPLALRTDQAQTNIVTSTASAVISFASK